MAGDSYMEEATGILKKLTGKKYIRLVSRGNEAILWALEIAAALGKKNVLIQDQGGWLTYLDYPPKFGMGIIKIKTVNGLIDPDDLEEKCSKDSVLLINSMPGYFVCDDMKSLHRECLDKGVLVINDASGSIGTDAAKYGEIIIGSFGKWKPVEVGDGGFIASDEKWFQEQKNHTMNTASLKKLAEALKGLKRRISYLTSLNSKVRKDLSGHDIVHRAGEGFNVAVKFSDENEKAELMKYCKENSLECTICPRYIRLNEPAVCIEIKRKRESER